MAAKPPQKRIFAIFFRTRMGAEPVRDWLKSLDKEDRKAIGDDIRRAEFGWPIGMPVAKAMGAGLLKLDRRCPVAESRAFSFLSRSRAKWFCCMRF